MGTSLLVTDAQDGFRLWHLSNPDIICASCFTSSLTASVVAVPFAVSPTWTPGWPVRPFSLRDARGREPGRSLAPPRGRTQNRTRGPRRACRTGRVGGGDGPHVGLYEAASETPLESALGETPVPTRGFRVASPCPARDSPACRPSPLTSGLVQSSPSCPPAV